jgi:uncharacterized membrane protein (UPF0136 family)
MTMPTGSAHSNITMAALVAAGGVAGYAKARSLPSLIAGLGFGAMYGGCAYLISNGQERLGHDLSTGLSVILATVMARRFLATRKVMPAGIAAGAAIVNGAYNASKSIEWRQ